MSWDEPPVERRPPLVDDAPRRQRRRKQTRKWCKGIVGREHVLTIRLKPEWVNLQLYERVGTRRITGYQPGRCQWQNWSWRRGERWHYSCGHQEVCVNCGKILDFRVPSQDCPDYHERDQSVADHLGAELRRLRGLRTPLEVINAMEWSRDKLRRVEAGESTISTVDLRALLAYYGVEERLVAELVESARMVRADKLGIRRKEGGTA